MPYQLTPYRNAHADTIADLMMRGAHAQAEGIRAQGQVSANLAGGLADIAQRGVQGYQQAREQQRQQARQDATDKLNATIGGQTVALNEGRLADETAQRTTAQRQQQAQQAAQQAVDAIRRGNGKAILDTLDPSARTIAEQYLTERDKRTNADRKERAQLAQKLGYAEPYVLALVGLDDDPSAIEHFQQQTAGDPAKIKQYVDAFATLGEKAEGPVKLGPGDVLVPPGGGLPLATNPKPETPEKVTYGAPQTQMVNGRRALVRAGSDGKIYDMNLRAIDAAAIAPEPQNAVREPVVAVMGQDGQPVYVPQSQAAGRHPANTREQGRPVTSGDAGRIADLDTSLNDLATLTNTIAPIDPTTGKPLHGPTGTSAAVGAALPNFVTNATGWGVEAKSKQAVIDRVKQVIGKALEGGVLRKEDEYKYEKILPTISDNPELVRTKLEGLQSAITQRRETTLDALQDANYDVSAFRARKAGGANKIGRFDVEVVP